MEAQLIIALIIAVVLAFLGAGAAGLFGGMWWQARQTAKVWEKAYTHVREQLNIKVDTYNTGRGNEQRDPKAWEAPPPPREQRVEHQRAPQSNGAAVMQAERNMLLRDDDDFDDPNAQQIRR